MTPDLSYYVYKLQIAGFAHTFVGSFVVCVPSGLLLLLVFYCVRKPVCMILPQPHRDALLPLCAGPKRLGGSAIAVILLCLLVGAWTHIFWDSFTHRTGWFVTHVSWLNQPALSFRSVTLPVYYILQQLSTLSGAGILLNCYLSWLRQQHVGRRTGHRSERWRYLLWFAIFLISLLVSLALAGKTVSPIHGDMAVRIFLFSAGVYGVTTAACLVLISAVAVHQGTKRS